MGTQFLYLACQDRGSHSWTPVSHTFVLDLCCVLSSSWSIPSLSTMSSALLHFFCVACGWQWITKTQRGTPSVAIGSNCFPWLWRDVEACHVTLDDVFVAQFGSASSTRRVIELAVKDMLGQATIFHTLPSQRRRRCLMIVVRSYEPVKCRIVELGTWSVVCLRGGERGTCLGPPLFGGPPWGVRRVNFP